MFAKPMFQAVVDGSKTQTRRIIKHPNYDFLGSPQPEIAADGVSAIFWESSVACIVHPRYYPGETVYLKEPYSVNTDCDVFYQYDPRMDQFAVKWKSKMFMPELYARHFIKITNVRVERLMDITEEDARREGCKIFGITLYNESGVAVQTVIRGNARKDFENLWNSINVKWNRKHDDYKGYLFADNPWIFVYSFELINKKS